MLKLWAAVLVKIGGLLPAGVLPEITFYPSPRLTSLLETLASVRVRIAPA